MSNGMSNTSKQIPGVPIYGTFGMLSINVDAKSHAKWQRCVSRDFQPKPKILQSCFLAFLLFK
jgi:hypothetical protein